MASESAFNVGLKAIGRGRSNLSLENAGQVIGGPYGFLLDPVVGEKIDPVDTPRGVPGSVAQAMAGYGEKTAAVRRSGLFRALLREDRIRLGGQPIAYAMWPKVRFF